MLDTVVSAVVTALVTVVVTALCAVVMKKLRPICAARRWWQHYRPSWAGAWANRRRQKAALREAEETAPGLLTKLQRSLEEDPDLRRFQVRTPGAFTIFDSSAAPAIIYLHAGDGALGDWVGRHADGLFRRVPDKSSPPVYEMSEELVRYLNGRGH